MRAALLALGALATISCLPGKTGSTTHVDMTGVALLDGGNVFASAPFPTHDPANPDGPLQPAMPRWIAYRGRETLRISFTPLAHEPTRVDVWLSFDDTGIGASPSFGDTAHVVALDAIDPFPEDRSDGGTPVSAVTISNNTEQDYFVRVVVE